MASVAVDDGSLHVDSQSKSFVWLFGVQSVHQMNWMNSYNGLSDNNTKYLNIDIIRFPLGRKIIE